MASKREDQLTKVSVDAAIAHVQAFYGALNSNREFIATFYAPTTSSIVFNGNPVADGPAVQDIFVNQMPKSHYEAQSFDSQIINQAYPTVTPTGVKPATEMTAKDMSLLLIVSGYVRYGEGREQPQRGFSETFVLVPNPSKPTDRNKRHHEWLIQSENFRLVV
ncbi:NTF2-like protein [Penicillium malachiteum]|uniref:NTF2-like protein n=1 Tax=Penicillium malachiteum TaxID=1324776 RepID=UPI002546B030|nr:NTF2-like protein [Penicillium malachiteum]KAJ5731228.1 NTF2-like protein [Penicillium malachiteum]